MNQKPDDLFSSRRKPSFSLLQLFYGVTLFAVGMALHNLTIPVSFLFLLAWGGAKANRDATLEMGKMMAAISAFIVVLYLVLVSSVRVRGDHGLAYCHNNVRQIALAMLNYESAHRELPKATFVSDTGIPYSWRVALLPQLDLRTVYDAYNFDEPWDSPANLKLLDVYPNPYYACTFQPDKRFANYKLVVGPGTAFDDTRPATKFGEISDGSSNTIAIVEDPTSTTPWTKPEDLTIDEAMKLMNDPPPHRNLHARKHSFHWDPPSMTIGFLDGHVDWYVPGHQPTVPREMFTCADGLTENWAHTFAEKRVRLPSMVRYDRFMVVFLYPVLAFLPAILAFFRPAAPF